MTYNEKCKLQTKCVKRVEKRLRKQVKVIKLKEGLIGENE